MKTLTDVQKGVYVEDWNISADELDIGGDWSIKKARLKGGLSDGVDTITVDNGKLSFVVVPTRGMGVWKGEYEGTFIGWDSPVKDLVHPRHVNLEARGGLGWLSGFNEWVVRCGLVSFGAPGVDTIVDNRGNKKEVTLTLHGRVANIPASVVKVRLEPPFKMGVEGTVYEASMFGPQLKMTTSITTTPGSNSLKISDTIQNLRSSADEMQLLYHCNYGRPFLEEGAKLVAPIRQVAPRDAVAVKGIESFDVYGPPETGFVEQVYFIKPAAGSDGRTKAMLVNSDATRAVSIAFNTNELPCLTVWKNTAAEEEGYVTGLEPGTNFPNPKPFERQRKRVVTLKAGEERRAEVILSVHTSEEEVREVSESIEEIQGKMKPKIFRNSIEDFSLV
ncbi:MAG: aldose 1-epimerase family protein [Candidatus Bathyarchaeota archaeon]|nr:aldose 1-epimerase family protein [Candidatus Bathyarchaeota archaeon]